MSNERLPTKALTVYLRNLINKVYKILPMKEEQCGTYNSYLQSLENELIGCYELWDVLADAPQFLAVMSIVKFLDVEDYDVVVCKREVFKAIHLIEDLIAKEGCNGEF